MADDDYGPEDSEDAPRVPEHPDHLNGADPADLSDDDLEVLKMEKTVNGDSLSDIDLTRKLIEQAAPFAAMSMIHLSRHAQNENTKMNASKWVVEFATQVETEGGRAAWEKLLPGIVDEAEKITADAVAGGDTTNDAAGYEIGD